MAGGDAGRVALDPRWQAIHKLRLEGLTFAEIGETLRLGSGNRTSRLWAKQATFEHAEEVRRAREDIRHRERQQRRVAAERRRRAIAEQRRRDFTRPACQRIVLAMQQWAQLHGAPPSALDWHSHYRARSARKSERYAATGRDWPTATNVVFRFGSWNAAMLAAGFEPRPPRRRQHRRRD